MRTIVVVDDEYSLADVLAASLSDVGFRVHTAANGVQGLQLVHEHHPDLVLLDYMMPLLDGPGVLRGLREDPRVASTPVILISSLPESSVRTRCDGYAAFLRKPFAFEALIATIERVLGGAPPSR